MKTLTQFTFLFVPILTCIPLLSTTHVARAQQRAISINQVNPTTTSELADVSLPSHAMRFTHGAVPQEISDTLQSMMEAGGPGVKRGRTEALGWMSNSDKKSHVAQIKSRLAASLRKGGWEYEEGEGKNGAVMVSAMRTTPTRKALIGFWTPTEDALVLAWTEMLPANSKNTQQEDSQNATPRATPRSTPHATSRTSSAAPATSALTEIKVPRGGQRFTAQNEAFSGFVKELTGKIPTKMTPTGDDAEVFIWRGDNYRTDRVDFVRSTVQGQLEAAGYTVKEIKEHELDHISEYNYFDRATNPEFFPTRTSGHFTAINAARGKAILGTWFQGDDQQVLALLPTQYKAKPKPEPLPSVGANVVLVKNIDDTMASLPRRVLPKFPPLARKPRMVRGWLRDMGGHPIANAAVAVYSSVGGGFRTTHKARSNAQGLYEVLLPTGIAEVAQVDADVSYNGQKFNLRLESASGEAKQFNGQNGHVENYVLRVAGTSGGTIRVLDNQEKGVVEITLTPVGRQIDGSPGYTLVYRFDTGDYQGETYLNGMPLGRYRLTARLLDDGEALPLRVKNTFGNDTLKTSLQVDFKPGFAYSSSNINKSNINVLAFEVILEP
jgi:hypothetical protein